MKHCQHSITRTLSITPDVVIKRLPRRATTDRPPTEVAIAQLLQASPHPNVVTILSTRTTPTEHRIVMPRYAKGDLFSHVEQAEPLPVLAIFHDLVQGLHHLHHHLHIAHLDLSLENVLMNEHGNVCICDFDLAERRGLVCHGGRGKRLYMGPEMYDPSQMFNGFQADMWSLGILLFILATGCPPIARAEDDDPRFRALRDHGVQYLLEAWKFTLPRPIVEILKKLLVINPEKRMTIGQLIAHPIFNLIV